MRPVSTALLVLIPLATACAHALPMTTITTRQNGTVKLCGEVATTDKLVSGRTPEGSKISIGAADIVTMEQNGVCKRK